MAGKTPDDSLLVLSNPIVKRAFWVVAGQVALEAAVESLLADRHLQSESDDEVIRYIEEADRHWRNQFEDCVRKPGVIEMYEPLMTACCKQRYQALRELRKAAPEEEKPGLSARMGRLLTVHAHCSLAKAESLLLNEKFREAYEAFERAEWAARMTPDEGSLRLCEILWARYGKWVTASLARRQSEMDSAHAEIGQVVHGAGPAARECLTNIEHLFSRHRWVFTERERLRRELRERQGSATGPSSREAEVTSPELELVSSLAAEVRSGRISLEEAKERARAHLPSLGLQPGKLMAAAAIYDTADPQRSVLLHEINCELALQLPDEPDLHAYCLGTLGSALNRLALTQPAEFPHALEVLERAYELVKAADDPGQDRIAARISNEAAVASRHLRNTAELLKWSQRAVERWGKWPDSPREMATAYGLRGEAREGTGELDEALEDHFRALALFRRARSGLDVRRAYHHVFELCLRANRLSEAAAAGEEIVSIAQQLGDLDDIQETTVPLVGALVRAGRFHTAALFLERAKRLTAEALEKDRGNPNLLAYQFDHLLWSAHLALPLVRDASSLSAADKRQVGRDTYEKIEKARQMALDLHDDAKLAQAWLEHALLAESTGNFTMADQCCISIDAIPDCPPGLRAFSFMVQGRIAARLESFPEAKNLLDYGLKTLGEKHFDDIRVRFLNIRGSVKENLGDWTGAIQDYEDAVKTTARLRDLLVEESQVGIFGMIETALARLFGLHAEQSPHRDTKRALHWAEYAKSRGLAELLGQSAFTLPQPSPDTAILYEEEQKLLAELHAGRSVTMGEAGRITLDQSYAQQTRKARLDELWDEMAVHHPEYVELRRGAVPSWDEIVEMAAG
jgi:tetratricopeptide (TPR) repeat protein